MNNFAYNNYDLRNPLPIGCVLSGEDGKEYQIMELVGRGGFAFTYKAFQRRTHAIFAIKEFLPNDMVERKPGTTIVRIKESVPFQTYQYSRERFEKEAKAIAKFQSDNIVRVHEDFSTNNTHYMVMEYLEGDTLKKYLDRYGRMEERYVRWLGVKLCSALSTIHSHGMIHRDLAPDNIIILENMDGAILTPKILDFGSARFLGQDYNENYYPVKHGYSAPEQYNRITPEHDLQKPWTDVYELGAVLYTCLTGRIPETAQDRQYCISQRRKDPLKAPNFINPMISPELNSIILHAMAVNPAMRFETAEEFGRALEGESGPKGPAPNGTVRTFLKKHSGVIAGVGIVMFLTILVGYISYSLNVLPAAEVQIWYLSDETGRKQQILEDICGELVKEPKFSRIHIEATGYPSDEYQEALETAYENGNLPSLFESLDDSDEYEDATIVLSDIYQMIPKNSCYFLDKNGGDIFIDNRIPIGFSVPVIYVNRNAITEEDSTMLKANGVYRFSDLMQLADGNAGTWDYAIDEDMSKSYRSIFPDFLEKAGNIKLVSPSPYMDKDIYLSSTEHYQDILDLIQSGSCDVLFAAVKSDEIPCKYTNYWSVASGESAEEKASKEILAYFYGTNAQIRFSSNESWTGIPLEKNAFENFRNNNSRLSGVLEDIDRFEVSGE